MYENVVVEHLRKHITARRNQPRTSSKACRFRSEHDNAIKQTELARASKSSSIYTTRCDLKTNEEIEIFPEKIYNTTIHKAAEASVMRDGHAFISDLTLRPFYVFRTCMRRPGCFPGAWSSWIVASRHFAPKIVEPSVRFNDFCSIYSSL